jgi:LysR family cyn operon transcriptional activator
MQTIQASGYAARIELRHLRYFLAVAEARSFTRAAERLNIAQPTLSHQIKQLEASLGAALLERGAKEVQLTRAGELFRPYCERTLKELDAGVQALSDLEGLLRGTLNMAVAHSFSAPMSAALSEFALCHPGVRVVAQLISRKEMEGDLLSGKLDLAVAYIAGDTDAFEVEVLGEEALVLVVDAGHPWTGRSSVEMSELAELPLVLLTPEFGVRQFVDEYFHRHALQSRPVLEMNAIGPILSTIRNSPLATILSEGALHNVPDVRVIPLVNPVPRRTLAIVWRRSAHRSAAASRMAEMIRDVYSRVPSPRTS